MVKRRCPSCGYKTVQISDLKELRQSEKIICSHCGTGLVTHGWWRWCYRLALNFAILMWIPYSFIFFGPILFIFGYLLGLSTLYYLLLLLTPLTFKDLVERGN